MSFALCGQREIFICANRFAGWDEGSTASITQLKAFQSEFGITPTKNPDQVSNIVSFVNLTAGIGALASFFLNDRLGRLWSFRLYMVIYIIGNLIETFSYGSLPALYVGRLVVGVGIGCLTVTCPMSIVEIAPSATRGLMTLWFNVCMLSSQMIGVFVVYGCNVNITPKSQLQWQVPFFVQTFVPAVGLAMSFFLYESPRWLAIRGRQDEALAALTNLRGLAPDHPHLETEWRQICDQIARETAEYADSGAWSIIRETLCKRSNLRRVQLTITVYILAQMSGANAVTNYLPEIFGIIGVKGTNTKIYSSGLYAFAKMICCVAASLFLVDVIGRRKSMLIGITVQMFCHSYLAGYLNVLTRNENAVSKGSSNFAIGAIFIHAFGWAIGKPYPSYPGHQNDSNLSL